jgi:hypothetical protein
VAISILQASITDPGNFAVATTITVTLTFAAGSAICVIATCDNTGTPTADCTDNNGGTYTQRALAFDSTNAQRIFLFSADNHASGSTTITVTFRIAGVPSAIGVRGIGVFEIGGASKVAYDTSAGQSQLTPGTATDAVTTGNMTPAMQPCMLVAASINCSGSTPPAVGTAFTNQGVGWSFGTANNLGRLESKRLTSTTVTAGTFTYSANDGALTIGAIFKEEAPLLSWAPSVPDRTFAPAPLVRVGSSVGPVAPVVSAPVPTGVVALAPDRVLGPVQPVRDGLSVQNVFPIPNAVPVGAGVMYPDRLIARPRSAPEGLSAQNVLPIPTPVPNDVGAFYPDRITVRPQPVREGMAVSPVLPIPTTVPVGWNALYPERVRAHQRAVAEGLVVSEPWFPIPDPNYKPLFPLKVSADGRSMVDQRDVPFRLQIENIWLAINHGSQVGYTQYLAELKKRGFTGTLFTNLVHSGGGAWVEVNEPADLAGNQPFTVANQLDTPNDLYFDNVKLAIDKAEALGMVVVFFHTYMGFAGGAQGWEAVVTSAHNTNTVCFNWGVYLATKFTNKNILWMHMGDHTISGTALTRFQQIVAGIQSVSRNRLASSELDNPNTLATSQPGFTYGTDPATSDMQFDWFYGWGAGQNGQTYATALAAWDDVTATIPVAIGEAIQVGAGFSALDTREQVRTQYHWAITSGAIAGGNFGVEGRWDWLTDTSALATFAPGALAGAAPDAVGAATQDAAYSNAFYQSLPWWNFRPSGTAAGRCGRDLIVVGVGTGNAFISSCMTRNGSHLIAYVPQQSASTTHTFSVDLRGMAGPSKAGWWNPITGAYDNTSGGATNGAYSLANTLSAQSFTSPGSNGQRDDWMLVVESLPPFGWGATYPDRVISRAPLVPVGLGVQNVLPLPAAAAPTGIVALAPDRILVAPRVREGFAVAPVLPQTAVTPVGWNALYPDRIVVGERARDQGLAVNAPTATLPAPFLSWSWSYPDRVPGALRIVAEGLDVSVPWLSALAPPPLSWAPSMPDAVPRGARRPIAEGWAVGQPWLSMFAVPGLGWLPTVPDRVWGPRPLVPEGLDVQNVLPLPTVTIPRGWVALYPDLVRGPRPLVPEGWSVGEPSLAALPVPFSAVFSSYFPDRVPGPRRPVQEGLTVAIPGLASLPVPLLSWAGNFPPFVRGALRPVNEGGGSLVIVPAPPAPSIAALMPSYPDRVLGRRPLVPEGLSVSQPGLASFPVPLASWRGYAPERVWGPARPVAEGMAVSPVLPIPFVAIPFGWVALYPDTTRAAARAVELGFLALARLVLTPPFVPGGASSLVRLSGVLTLEPAKFVVFGDAASPSLVMAMNLELVRPVSKRVGDAISISGAQALSFGSLSAARFVYIRVLSETPVTITITSALGTTSFPMSGTWVWDNPAGPAITAITLTGVADIEYQVAGS